MQIFIIMNTDLHIGAINNYLLLCGPYSTYVVNNITCFVYLIRLNGDHRIIGFIPKLKPNVASSFLEFI